MGFGEPRSPAPTGDERELLLGFIGWQRDQVAATTDGLDEEQLRWAPEGGLVPIIGVVNHLSHMERRWIEGRYLGAPFPARTDEWRVGDDVYIQERLFLAERLSEPFDPACPERHAGPRLERTPEGRRVAEWHVKVRDVADFLNRRRAAGVKA